MDIGLLRKAVLDKSCNSVALPPHDARKGTGVASLLSLVFSAVKWG